MLSMDIFRDDAFSLQELIAALERVPYVPSLLGQLGIFEDEPVRTEFVSIEQREHQLTLIPVSERGAPAPQQEKDGRDIRAFRTRRLRKSDVLRASELLGVRQFGSMDELAQVADEVMRRLTRLRRDMDLTQEHMRLGAVQGIVLDADGSTVLDNWFTEWQKAQPAEIDFALGTATTEVRLKCHEVRRAMRKAAKGSWIDGVTQVHALCGEEAYDKLITHKSVKETYLNWSAAQDMRTAEEYRAFAFGGVVFHDYRGTDDGSVGIEADKMKFFPVGAPGVFKRALSPGESFEHLGAPGEPLYPRVIPDEKRDEYVEIELSSYPLYICTNPLMLQRAKA